MLKDDYQQPKQPKLRTNWYQRNFRLVRSQVAGWILAILALWYDFAFWHSVVVVVGRSIFLFLKNSLRLTRSLFNLSPSFLFSSKSAEPLPSAIQVPDAHLLKLSVVSDEQLFCSCGWHSCYGAAAWCFRAKWSRYEDEKVGWGKNSTWMTEKIAGLRDTKLGAVEAQNLIENTKNTKH